MNLSWGEFLEEVYDEFTDLDYNEVFWKFKSLKQVEDVNDYQIRFEKWKNLLFEKNRRLHEDYFVSSFISGLRDEIGDLVQMFRPTTVAHAIALAKLQENHLKMLEGKVEQCLKVEMKQEENEDKFLKEVLSKEEPASEVCADGSNAKDGNDACAAGSKILESTTIRALGIESRNEAMDSELGQVNGAVWKVGICNSSEISKDFTMENKGQAFECIQVDRSNSASKEFDFEIPYVEHLKLLNEEVEDPFYDPINSVQLNGKIQLLLAVGLVVYKVKMKILLIAECVVYLVLRRVLLMCDTWWVLQWIRKGVG